jgi:hypothetical protein
MLLCSNAVRKWNPTKFGSADDLLQSIVATRSIRGLVAKTIEEVDVAKAMLGRLILGEGSATVLAS